MKKGFTLWFTGLPCSGKTVVSHGVACELRKAGAVVKVLDGDFAELGCPDDDTLLRCIGFASKLLSEHGVIVCTSFVSSSRDIRNKWRREIENFVEVFIKCPVEVCIKRDTEGMRRDEILIMSNSYDEPDRPDIVVNTHRDTPAESIQGVLNALERIGYGSRDYSERDEARITERLRLLGYL